MVFLEDSWTELMVLPLHAGGNWTPESIRSQTNEVVNLNQHRLVYLSGACSWHFNKHLQRKPIS
jgi:hypothetical protein